MAAPTTSLPEQIGGERNWDYRYVWVRDAAFCVYALLRLGFTSAADAFMQFILRYATAREDSALRLGAQQHLRHRQAHKFRIGQLLGPARLARAGGDHVIVDQHLQCRQEGFQVCSHERPWMPSSHFTINPTSRTDPSWEPLI